jgi:uncharacterized protein
MEFMVIAFDGTDEDASGRRLAARERHLELFDEFTRRGYFKYGCAILNDSGTMIGSVVACEFESREELDRVWLSHEPYVTGDVWRIIDVRPIRTRIPVAPGA